MFVFKFTYLFIYFWERAGVPFWMFSAKQGNYLVLFYNVVGMTRFLTGDWTSRTRSQYSTTRLSRSRWYNVWNQKDKQTPAWQEIAVSYTYHCLGSHWVNPRQHQLFAQHVGRGGERCGVVVSASDSKSMESADRCDNIKGSRCFLEQYTSASLPSPCCFDNRTTFNWYKLKYFRCVSYFPCWHISSTRYHDIPWLCSHLHYRLQ